eukprot:4098759-Amphidinium_carterae.1
MNSYIGWGACNEIALNSVWCSEDELQYFRLLWVGVSLLEFIIWGHLSRQLTCQRAQCHKSLPRLYPGSWLGQNKVHGAD